MTRPWSCCSLDTSIEWLVGERTCIRENTLFFSVFCSRLSNGLASGVGDSHRPNNSPSLLLVDSEIRLDFTSSPVTQSSPPVLLHIALNSLALLLNSANFSPSSFSRPASSSDPYHSTSAGITIVMDCRTGNMLVRATSSHTPKIAPASFSLFATSLVESNVDSYLLTTEPMFLS